MSTKKTSTRKIKRIPKPGCFFRGLLILGYLFVGFGGLTILGGLAGFIATLIKTIPDIIEALNYLDQGFTLFVLTIFATYFGVFAGLGCVGIIIVGMGILLIFKSTAPMEQPPIDKPLPLA
jgi:hypothetical protein